ncbi:23S rRNA (uracil(1939)-C(5))-methyltransferase RlmD [uncultured archaeon]|nr:23S rRNA (uracil(1939)-C(5))-methyltransferase RlmD [uncultured archaeon]
MKVYLTEDVAQLILQSKEEEVEVTLDLGKTSARVGRKILLKMPLEKVTGDFIYLWDGRELFKIAIAAEHYYKLRMLKGAPVLEIDGVRMQILHGFSSPLVHPKKMAHKLGIAEGESVLDTCTGLGYAAIAAAEKGAHVKTVENDANVVEIAKANPWSRALFENKGIEAQNGDVFETVKTFEQESFDKIMHDPPRFSKGGGLYSEEFYRQLLRVAKKGARLFHYVGNPGRGKGRRLWKEIAQRLEKAGWKHISHDAGLQGLFAEKKHI